MIYPLGDTPLAKADYLVAHKGEMSVELWCDRAQCVLAPLAAIVRATERERDTARTRLAEVERERDQWEQSWNDQVSVTTVRINERDTARAQVETLAEALRKFRDHHFYGNASAEARAALKAAELDNTSGESK